MENGNYKMSITGDLGSGKSSVCAILCDKYGFKRYSTGVIQREIALRYNMDTLEFNKYTETHPEIDDEIDNGLKKLADVDEKLVVDSRMAWHFVPNTFKIFLSVDIREAARRIINANRGNIEQYENEEDAVKKLRARKESENKRYLKQYGVDCADFNNFDVVIDSTVSDPEELADLMVSLRDRKCGGEDIPKMWRSYKTMLPTKADVDEAKVRELTEEIKNGGEPVITVAETEEGLLITDGHEAVCAYAAAGVNTVPYVIEKAEAKTSPEIVSAWEEKLGFKFRT